MRFSLDKIYTSLFFIICFSLAFIGDKLYAIPNGANIALVLLFPFVINWSQLAKRLKKKLKERSNFKRVSRKCHTVKRHKMCLVLTLE